VRVHIPIQTNQEVEFAVAGQPLPMSEGDCWYVNFNLPHRIHNRGTTDRVHLVIDCVLNDWLRGMFPDAAGTIV
jgi:mannose-6-phosphate isomerase-like protein (cupin superfamily)